MALEASAVTVLPIVPKGNTKKVSVGILNDSARVHASSAGLALPQGILGDSQLFLISFLPTQLCDPCGPPSLCSLAIFVPLLTKRAYIPDIETCLV